MDEGQDSKALEEQLRQAGLRIKELEAAINDQTQDRSQMYLDLAGVMFIALDQEGRVTLANQKAMQILKVTEEQILQQNWFEVFIPEAERTRVQVVFQQLMAGEREPVEFHENRVMTREGELRDVAWHNTMLHDEQGRIIGTISSGEDITERKQAEREKRRILELSQDLFCIANVDGYFKYVNPAWTRTLGYKEEELLSRPLLEFVHPEDRTGTGEEVALLLEGNATVDFENRYLHADGTSRIISWRAVPIPEGQLIYGVGRDVTEQRRLQVEYAQTDRLASVGLLAAGVAHEINNPLTYLLFNLSEVGKQLPILCTTLTRLHQEVGEVRTGELLGSTKAQITDQHLDELVSMTYDALEGAERIERTVNDLRTFSRAEEAHESPLALNEVIESTLHMADNEIKYRAKVRRDLGELPLVMANDGKLAQVFLNLLVNAAHSIAEGDVEHNEISVRTWSDDREVFTEVADTGAGIAPGHLPRIFDAFFTTKEVGRGSGLGLSICHSIVTGYGGSIEVESEVGQGTRFLVRLPRGASEAPEVVEPPAGEVEEDTQRRRILVVDDEPSIGEVIRRILADEYRVMLTTSGAEAHKLLQEDQGFDAIICDLMMPDVTGMELYQVLAEEFPALAQVMVFITGGAFTPRAMEFVARNRNPLIEKPLRPSQLLEIIQQVIGPGSRG